AEQREARACEVARGELVVVGAEVDRADEPVASVGKADGGVVAEKRVQGRARDKRVEDERRGLNRQRHRGAKRKSGNGLMKAHVVLLVEGRESALALR